MSQGDGASVYVELFGIEVQLAIAGQHLRGERFVQFDQIEIGGFEAVFGFHLAQRRDWPNAHDAWIDTSGSDRANASERLEMVLPGELLVRQHNSGCSVGDAR